ncbi:isoprenoid synthase domain-containing protein [Armillaria fumosa]|nr:isoprenoid synthase domain-containing protein [Armillaria fumosa]
MKNGTTEKGHSPKNDRCAGGQQDTPNTCDNVSVTTCAILGERRSVRIENSHDQGHCPSLGKCRSVRIDFSHDPAQYANRGKCRDSPNRISHGGSRVCIITEYPIYIGLRTKLRPSDEVVLGDIAQEFWALGVKSASSTSQKHFVESLGYYVDALVEEAEDRHHHRIRNVEEYFDICRWNIGIYMVYAMLELSYDIPDEVFNYPTFVALRSAASLPTASLDLASYNKEQALEEHPHNILECVMNEQKCDLHDALSWVEDTYRSTRNKFLMLWTEIPSWGPEMDAIASHYLHGIANWVRGNECWNFESERYFGSNGRNVQQHRMVPLMPKQLLAREPLLVHVRQAL